MSGDDRDDRFGSAYVLEKTYTGQVDWSLFFVYSRREHIRALLQDMYIDNPDPDLIEGMWESHDSGESADLWLIEHGRCTGRVDLRPFILTADEGDSAIDWTGFDAAVPAALNGPPLKHGEELRLQDAAAYFQDTARVPADFYPDEPVRYGMQVWVDGNMLDQPYDHFTDPDPEPA
ncbi:hypothetical protein O4J56_19255 [Nocardiopsis sp. RSe5-2]|uniref:Uncharacterized protein n=1 Tax=Nocardiopsis endophytica TaxID=3018445 RepID=A0ABT4U787_9ACTN|nr:hypothetical protein [Nocardiopsis endophytica]MDA2812791.1 hypothetical protein [Nocardiopsis endophytica]